jgi:hypothetical protein
MKQYPPDESGQAPLAGAGGGQLRLVIEVDVTLIKEAGYEVVRFTDTQVIKDIQNVIVEIEKNIEELERQDEGKFAKVHPQPPPAGDIAISQVSAKKDVLSSEE